MKESLRNDPTSLSVNEIVGLAPERYKSFDLTFWIRIADSDHASSKLLIKRGYRFLSINLQRGRPAIIAETIP
jgi:hypothetical protein